LGAYRIPLETGLLIPSGKSCGLKGSTQRLAWSHLALKTKAKTARWPDQPERCPGYGLTEYSQTDGSSAGVIVESMHWMVLHRPVELARVIGNLKRSREETQKWLRKLFSIRSSVSDYSDIARHFPCQKMREKHGK
jgi:hypothetical protein